MMYIPFMLATKLDRKNRLVTMLLDHAIMCFVCAILLGPLMLYEMWGFAPTKEVSGLLPHSSLYEVFVFSLYFNKYIYLGQSIGKRLLKFQILDVHTNRPANPLRCLVRNLTILVWPVEVVAALINVERRVGDYMAGTRLVPFEAGMEERPNWGLMVCAVMGGMLYTYGVWFYALGTLFHFW